MSEDDIDRKLKEKKAQLELIRKRNKDKADALAREKAGGGGGSKPPSDAVSPTGAVASAKPGTKPAEDAAAALRSVTGVLSTPHATPTAASSGSAASHHIDSKRKPVKLSHSAVVNVDIAPIEKITYEMASQTDPMNAEQIAGQRVADDSNIRAQLDSYQKSEAKLMADLRTVSDLNATLLAKQNENTHEVAKHKAASERELTPAERTKLTSSDEFQKFFARSTQVALRAVQQNIDFDIMVDYTEDTQATEANALKVEEKAVRKLTFGDATGPHAGRPVTSLSFSPKYKELLCVSYAPLEENLTLEPDGLVLVWSTHMPQRAEYTFTCQSAVLSAQFHPTNPRLIMGATYSGQIVMWDTREKSAPVNRTSLSDGHTQPVFAFATVPAVNKLHNIVSLSSDGHLCVWSDNDLHAPSTQLTLRHGKDGKEEITSSAFDFPGRDSNSIVLASDEGTLYKARIYSQPGIYEEFKAHDAPITQIQFHPTNKNSPASVATDLFLTSSYDWTVKLWSNKLQRPLFIFESAKDYVYDVQWSPVHPAVFASGDGSGRLDVWNVSHDTEVPLISIDVNNLNATPSTTGGSGSAGDKKAAAGDKKGDSAGNGGAADSKDSKDKPATAPASLGGGADGADEKDGGADAPTNGAAISRLRWSEDGGAIAVGTSTGQVVLYALSGAVAQPTNDDASRFFDKIHKGRQSSTTVSSALGGLNSAAPLLHQASSGSSSAAITVSLAPGTPATAAGAPVNSTASTPTATFTPPPLSHSRTGL